MSSSRTPSSTLCTVLKMVQMRFCIIISRSFTMAQNLHTHNSDSSSSHLGLRSGGDLAVDQLVVDLRVELGAPSRVLDVQDALVQGSQPLQAPLKVPLDLQHVTAELGALAATEDGQRPLLAVLPASKLVLTVADLV